MRSVGEAAGVEGEHARIDIVAAEEIAGVIEDHFLIVVIVVKKRNFQRPRIGLERARREGADDEPLGQEGGVDRWRQMIAMAGHRPDVLDVQPDRRELAVPADGVQRVVGIGDTGNFTPFLDLDRHFAGRILVIAEGLVHHRRVEDGRVEQGVRA